MQGVDLTCFSGKPERLGRDAEQPCPLTEVEIRFHPVLRRPIDGDRVVGAQRGHPPAGPAVTIASDKAISIKMPAIKSSLAISTRWRTAAMMSGAVLLR